MECAFASRHDFSLSARSHASARHGGGAFGSPCANEGGGGGRRRAHRWSAAVRRGGDTAPIGARPARRYPGDPTDAATIADGAAGPPWVSTRGCADWGGDWARFLL